VAFVKLPADTIQEAMCPVADAIQQAMCQVVKSKYLNGRRKRNQADNSYDETDIVSDVIPG